MKKLSKNTISAIVFTTVIVACVLSLIFYVYKLNLAFKKVDDKSKRQNIVAQSTTESKKLVFSTQMSLLRYIQDLENMEILNQIQVKDEKDETKQEMLHAAKDIIAQNNERLLQEEKQKSSEYTTSQNILTVKYILYVTPKNIVEKTQNIIMSQNKDYIDKVYNILLNDKNVIEIQKQEIDNTYQITANLKTYVGEKLENALSKIKEGSSKQYSIEEQNNITSTNTSTGTTTNSNQ